MLQLGWRMATFVLYLGGYFQPTINIPSYKAGNLIITLRLPPPMPPNMYLSTDMHLLMRLMECTYIFFVEIVKQLG